MVKAIFALVFVIAAVGAHAVATISGSGPKGVYYLIAGAVADVFNHSQNDRSLAVVPSRGSVENVNRLLSGRTDFAIVQADILRSHLEASNHDKTKGLLPLLKMGEEVVSVIAASSSGITSLGRMRGKNINIGPKGSSHHANAVAVLDSIQPNWRTQNYVFEEPVSQALEKISRFEMDATFSTMFHPNPSTQQILSRSKRKLRLVPIAPGKNSPEIARHFRRTLIDKDIYKSLDNWRDVPTIGTYALLVARKGIPASLVESLCESLGTNFSRLRSSLSPIKLADWEHLRIDDPVLGDGGCHPRQAPTR